MHVSVLDFFGFVRISVVGKPTEARSVQVHGQWLVTCDQHIDSHVELFASNQQRIHDVTLHDVGLGLWTLWLPSKIVLPLRDLSELVQQEDAPALGLANRLHDPHSSNLTELLHEKRVVPWQVVSRREEVEARYGC